MPLSFFIKLASFSSDSYEGCTWHFNLDVTLIGVLNVLVEEGLVFGFMFLYTNSEKYKTCDEVNEKGIF